MDKTSVNSIVLKLPVIYSLAQQHTSYYLVAIIATALKICHETEH